MTETLPPQREKWEQDLKTEILRKAQDYESIQVEYVAALQERVAQLRENLFQCYDNLLQTFTNNCEGADEIIRKYRDLNANSERCVLLLEQVSKQIEQKVDNVAAARRSAVLNVLPLSRRKQFFDRSEEQRRAFEASLSPEERKEFARLTRGTIRF